ncbi:hypothetical protein BCR34DRAFT_609778 [Clohesyomyces aquaticus]|uniref:Actin-like ATPase domain-containing protein n=1 Tax=Clohesyomyces aquaticus TaxID=1231657 RepID=A0A1Y2A9E1_9PLEO|nr:hypothetical protein BCR34DRAFT_609778 [Clohesyomyces aquaticus]
MAYEAQEQPIEYSTRKTPPIPSISPPPPPSSQTEIALSPRRPAPYALNSSTLSSNQSRYSSVTSPRSLPSSRTSYSAGEHEQTHINIGIDFGTTYSGVSWAISNQQNPQVNVVTNWPDAPAENPKVPTEIWYTKGGIQWGYSIPPEAEPLKWFKLLLLKHGDMPPKIADSDQLVAARKLLEKIGKPLVEVIADYLHRLWDFAIQDINRQLGASVDGMPFRVVMTVPANWPRDAQKEMEKAAKQAGILDRRMGGLETKFEFVAEPEAAAIASFLDENLPRNLKASRSRADAPRDIIVICDAGGGTVDIATYQIERMYPAVNIGECIFGEADLCGSIFLDQGFQKHIEGMIGTGKLAKMPQLTRRTLMSMWENNMKRQFSKTTSEIVGLLPHEVAKAIKSPINRIKRGNATKQLRGDNMRFCSDDIRGIFEPVMKDILTLINGQILKTVRKKQQKPKAILLVGGLGSNKFLYQKLQAEYSAGDIDLIQPQGPKPWSAICRGAALKGMAFDDWDEEQPMRVPTVTSYISKAHYGIVCKVPFDDSKHKEEDRKFDHATNQDLAYNQMQWYIGKGDDVSKGNPVTLSWEKFHPNTKPCTSFSVKIFECDADEAPARMTNEVRECETIDFPINWGSLAVREGAKGQLFRRVQFDLKVTMLGMGKVKFATFVDDIEVGQKNVKVRVGDGVIGRR